LLWSSLFWAQTWAQFGAVNLPVKTITGILSYEDALRKFGLDPASASAPFVAKLVDVSGLVI
jgi:Mg/Co/Ni transporter MgtE